MELYIDSNPSRRKQLPLHAHEQVEIIFYLKGTGRLCTETRDYPFVPGQAILVPPGYLHRSTSEGDFRSISVSGDFSHLIMTDVPVVLWDNELGDGAYLAQLIYRSRHEDSQFLTDLACAYVRFWMRQADMTGAPEEAVSRVYREMSEHAFDKDIDVSGILDASGYAQDYIRMLFKKRYGIPPVKFLAKMRIEHACFLLNSYRDSVPLSEIAESVGYDDYVYFSRTFKAFTGKSPREYAKALRK